MLCDGLGHRFHCTTFYQRSGYVVIFRLHVCRGPGASSLTAGEDSASGSSLEDPALVSHAPEHAGGLSQSAIQYIAQYSPQSTTLDAQMVVWSISGRSAEAKSFRKKLASSLIQVVEN